MRVKILLVYSKYGNNDSVEGTFELTAIQLDNGSDRLRLNMLIINFILLWFVILLTVVPLAFLCCFWITRNFVLQGKLYLHISIIRRNMLRMRRSCKCRF